MNLGIVIIVLSALLAGLVATNEVLENAFPKVIENSMLLRPNPLNLVE